MKIVAMLAFYDEQPEMLDRAVRSAANSGVDHIVVCDGAYQQLPGGKADSPPEQLDAIKVAASVCGTSVEFASGIWPDEMAKRNQMMRMADKVAGPEDWLLVLDADFDVRGNLRKAVRPQYRVMACQLTTPDGPTKTLRYGCPSRMVFRVLYRGGQQIKVVGNHYSYFASDGARLWGSALGLPPLEAPGQLEGIEVIHWTYYREPERVFRQIDYYVERDRVGVERGPCLGCGVVSSCFVPIVVEDKGDEIDTRFAEACDTCAPVLLKRSRQVFATMGGDNPYQLMIVKPG